MVNALEQYDPQIFELIRQEEARQSGSIRLIPSENYVSRAVMLASGSCLTNKYAEGYPGQRYYEGQQVTDLIEKMARGRVKKLFKADHLSLPHGGHLTHGWKVSVTSKIFNSVPYTVDPDTGRFDYNQIEELAKKHKPKLIISGATAYPREIDFEIFGQIAKDVGAYHVSDIAHVAGLVVAGIHKSPVPFADIVSTTSHKTLRGPRGGMLLCKAEHAENVDRAVFPGLQGGPHMHTLTAIAVAMAEADTPEFVAYAEQIVKNAKALAEKLLEYGFNLSSGGTDNHLILIDLRNKNILGKKLAKALDRARIVTNYNTTPLDPAHPSNPSGLRLGTPAITTRGMKEEQARHIAGFINKVAENIDNESVIEEVGKEVLLLSSQFSVPEHFIIPNKNNPHMIQASDDITPWLF
jgi:glycine hydroxymethyltransferase